MCEHGRIRSRTVDMRTWSHNVYLDCGGSQMCEHGRQRSNCKDCVEDLKLLSVNIAVFSLLQELWRVSVNMEMYDLHVRNGMNI